MSDWDRRDALALVYGIESRIKALSIDAVERQGLWQVTQNAKRAAETCSTDANRILSIRRNLCRVCVSGTINGCGPVNAGTAKCFWLAGEVAQSGSTQESLIQ